MSASDKTDEKNLKSFLPKELVPLARNLLLIFGGIGAVISLFGDYSEGGDLLNDVFLIVLYTLYPFFTFFL